jgi:DNA-binding response OmpR family regulator
MNTEPSVSALLVGEYDVGDRLLVRDVFQKCGWRLFEAPEKRRAALCLECNPVQVVIAESDVPNWNWKNLLLDLQQHTCPQQLIITLQTADKSLWAEVLNLGGYDVLARPLGSEELERVVAAAARHFYSSPGRAGRAQSMRPAAALARPA